jgi:hypothetical protein
LTAAGCGAPFGPCYSELVQVAFAGSVDGTATTGSGEVALGNIGGDFYQLRDFVIEGTPLPGHRIVWLMTGFSQLDFLSVWLPASVTRGQVLQVSEVLQGGGWGVLPGTGLAISARIGAGSGFATAASGTVTVERLAPLRLATDLTVSNAEVTRRIVGQIDFALQRDRVACT